jgi:hypothetical protein
MRFTGYNLARFLHHAAGFGGRNVLSQFSIIVLVAAGYAKDWAWSVPAKSLPEEHDCHKSGD